MAADFASHRVGALDLRRVASDARAENEESCLAVVFLECVKDSVGRDLARTVVKCERDIFDSRGEIRLFVLRCALGLDRILLCGFCDCLCAEQNLCSFGREYRLYIIELEHRFNAAFVFVEENARVKIEC